MTEAEWLMATDLDTMLMFLRVKTSHFTERKLQLLSCACCYLYWTTLVNESCREVVRVAERFADQLVSIEELVTAVYKVDENAACDGDPSQFVSGNTLGGLRNPLETCSYVMAQCVAHEQLKNCTSWEHHEEIIKKEQLKHIPFLRDIFGNPLRPVTLDTSWLSSTVLALAQGIYSEKAFDRMPILADALQDAGCDNEEVLNHCRQPGVHVRGCWVVDLLTDRK
jgi:hypothetical protein